MTSDHVAQIAAKVKLITQSLQRDIGREAVEAAGQNPEGSLPLQPWMAGGYLEGNQPLMARELLHRHLAGDELKRNEFCAVRNCLALQLLLSNFKRAGDISSLERNAILEARCESEEEGVEIFVSWAFQHLNRSTFT